MRQNFKLLVFTLFFATSLQAGDSDRNDACLLMAFDRQMRVKPVVGDVLVYLSRPVVVKGVDCHTDIRGMFRSKELILRVDNTATKREFLKQLAQCCSISDYGAIRFYAMPLVNSVAIDDRAVVGGGLIEAKEVRVYLPELSRR